MSEIYLTIDDQDYKITSNKNEWKIAEFHGVTEKGTDQLSNTLHYANIEGLVDGLARKEIRTSDYDSLKDLRDNIQRILEEIKSKLSSLIDVES